MASIYLLWFFHYESHAIPNIQEFIYWQVIALAIKQN
ncbi:Uncharacterised protein [Segatella copri]|nr:Uncharacterised protein [Segatella copri]